MSRTQVNQNFFSQFNEVASRAAGLERLLTNGLHGTLNIIPQSITAASLAPGVSVPLASTPMGGSSNVAYKEQFGQLSISVPSGVLQDITVSLPAAWTTQHLVFIANVWPTSTSGYQFFGAQPSGLTFGTVAVSTTSTQTMQLTWLSRGY